MFDKLTTELLKILNDFCKDSTYKVLSKREIINKFPTKIKIDDDYLSQMLGHLAQRNYLDIKYFDDKVYCLAVLPKGRLFDEKVQEINNGRKKFNKKLVLVAIVASLSGFLGAMLGAIVSKLIF